MYLSSGISGDADFVEASLHSIQFWDAVPHVLKTTGQ